MLFKEVVTKILGNVKNPGCLSPNVHFLHNRLDFFSWELGRVSVELGKRSHQDIKEMEETVPGTVEY